jgi:drug/metabolite transporter (DMT)-like permease
LFFPTGLFLALHFTFWIASLRYTSVASSVVIVNINPVFVGLGSSIILKEEVTKWIILGETVSLWKAAGGIPILTGIYVALRADITGVGLIISRGRE